jgi:cytochrome c biogenesis protein CcmG, thiol:disulfide interchange protein DsbE
VTEQRPRPTPVRPTFRIGLLVGIAAFTTLAIVGLAVLNSSAPSSSGTIPGGIAQGQAVPNVEGTTLDGSTIDLASLRGHPVVINFWGPSCVPCRTEFPLLAAKAQEHAAAGLVIIGVLTDDPVEPARAFAAQYGSTWQTVIDPGGAIKSAYHVVARPQSYFVDANGILQSIQIGQVEDQDFERQYAAIAGGS